MALIPIYCPNCQRCVGTVSTTELVLASDGLQAGLAMKPVSDILWRIQATRIRGALAAEKITTVGELVQMTEAELMRIPNMGRLSVREIKFQLEEMGLRLGMGLEMRMP